MAAGPEGLEWDYVIVGSGAGVGRSRRALVSRRRVFLLEAGGDARGSDAARMPDDTTSRGSMPMRARTRR
jgi:choline dehydrogenase-like flavoprotein